MEPDLEERIIQGKARWITSFLFDLVECSSKLFLTSDPDCGRADQLVEFRDVRSLSVNRYHDSVEDCLGDFLGVEVRVANDCCEYLINTGDSEVSFQAAPKPIVTSVT